MQLLGAFQEPKPFAELIMQQAVVISHNIKTAALGGAFRSERTDNHVTAGTHSAGNRVNVGRSLLG